MALLFIDSFDHYTTEDDLRQKWTTYFGSAEIAPGEGRCGTQALSIPFSCWLDRGLLFGDDTFVCGFAWKQYGALSIGGSPMVSIVGFEGTLGSIFRNFDGSIGYECQSGSEAVSVPNVILQDTWVYIEWKVYFHLTLGTCQVRVNEIEVINYTGRTIADWPAGAVFLPITVPPRSFHIQGTSNNAYVMDDLYILDGTGSAPCNDFLGDSKVEYLRPNAAGSSAQWTPVGAATNWQAVDDNAAPDHDTSYVESVTPGQIDSNNYEPTGLPSGPIFGAQLGLLARKSEVGPRVIAPMCNAIVGNPIVGVSAETYQYWNTVYENNPVTGLPWTIAEINAAQFGVKVVS